MKHRGKQLTSLFLALALLLTACGGGKATAATMRLIKTEGNVSVDDAEEKSVQLMENLGLFSGYGVDTRSESYAWINLDEVKLTKMDQDSEVEIQKDGKRLELEVKSGSLFFHVTEPLAADETMEIRSSTMLVGIRGTCGWVNLAEEGDRLSVYLLEGKVRCEADGEKETVRAGEMAVMTKDGEITVEKFSAADVPAFVLEEIEDDDDLMEAILDDSGIDVSGGTSGGDLDDYADILDRIRADGHEVLYAEVLDFEVDGKPELLTIVNESPGHVSVHVRIYRKGLEGTGYLTRYLAYLEFSDNDYYDVSGKISLVEYGGRLFVKNTQNVTYTQGEVQITETYTGSVAPEEGSIKDWNTVDYLRCTQARDGVRYLRLPHDERGLVDGRSDYYELSAEDFAAVQAQYNELKVLVYFPDDKSYIVLPDPSEIEEPPIPTEPDTLPTDGDRIVLQGTVNTCSGAEILNMQGAQDPNPGQWSESGDTFRVIVLDTPQAVTAINGDGDGSSSGEATMIDVTYALGLDQYDGQHVIFSIDPNETWWPSDTSLPLGQPRTEDIHVLG